jgi:hypothetical protein
LLAKLGKLVMPLKPGILTCHYAGGLCVENNPSNQCAIPRIVEMIPITVSYHLEAVLKGTSLEGWADYVGLTAVVVLLFAIRSLFFATRKQDISGKVALVTGGGRGIGFLMAKKLALDHGCKVIFIMDGRLFCA